LAYLIQEAPIIYAKTFHLILTASMNDQSPSAIYEAEKTKCGQQLKQLKEKQSMLGWLRLGVAVVTGVTAFYLFNSSLFFGIFILITGIGFFLVVVSIDTDNNRKISHLKFLIQINHEELDSLAGIYDYKYDGIKFLPSLHDYAHDMDIFGKFSLFQLINRGSTDQGRALLANNFLSPLPVEEIKARHQAIKELSPQYAWRQQLQAILYQAPLTKATEGKVKNWVETENNSFTHSAWKFIIAAYSVFTIGTAIVTIAGYMPASVFFFLFIIYFIFSSLLGRKASQINAYLTGIVKEVGVMHQLMKWIEDKRFSASILQQLQQSVAEGEKKAYNNIKELKSLLDRFDLRLNWFLFPFINGFLLWDVRQIIALNKWKDKNRKKISLWYTLIAEFEVLNSLSTVHFNHPGWVIPDFSNEHFSLETGSLGHPLIQPAQRVNSNFSLKGQAKVALVTGSNMAGKSTFLRSLGVNIVLAQMGSPVCATAFTLSPNKLMSSMRIADNLAENTSTFYAELKKLKTILEAVNRHEPVFILLDEILRGTNSLDKHTGSEALIRQLIKQKAVAVLATHDVELAKLENEFSTSLENYHFDVQVEGEELYFDYKLKHGVCTSLNASILMKKIGIEV
jgi:ABC-type multidrug transport system fused ATPase/permease subunit